jgi:hypothetical protein
MFGLFIQREDGSAPSPYTCYTRYATALEAYRARMEYVAAAKRNGFRARRYCKVTFLRARGVRLEVWVDRVERPN